jgi:hypothetical protein
MSTWDDYPSTYRQEIVQRVLRATHAGDSVALLGLSGAGKSNVAGFIAHCALRAGASPQHHYLLIDCNRLTSHTPAALFNAMRVVLAGKATGSMNGSQAQPVSSVALPLQNEDAFHALEVALREAMPALGHLTFVLDRFDVFAGADAALFNPLRALRDEHKYALSYVTTSRRPHDPRTELAELFFANTLWLGSLSEEDALWNVARYAQRFGVAWDEAITPLLLQVSGRYPSLLKACADALAAGCEADAIALSQHPSVQRRVEEFWADGPSDADIEASGLARVALLMRGKTPSTDAAQANLTAKEHLLLAYLQSRAGQVCEKDDIIRAVWPEDKVIERGIRDDSLAQLVRRLREKIEADAGKPRYIMTVPGRGYKFQK